MYVCRLVNWFYCIIVWIYTCVNKWYSVRQTTCALRNARIKRPINVIIIIIIIISWSWNSSPTISWPVRYASVYIIHMYPMRVAQSAARGTVEIRMTIGCAQLKRNHDLIGVLHCHVRAHSSWLRNRNSVVRI